MLRSEANRGRDVPVRRRVGMACHYWQVLMKKARPVPVRSVCVCVYDVIMCVNQCSAGAGWS